MTRQGAEMILGALAAVCILLFVLFGAFKIGQGLLIEEPTEDNLVAEAREFSMEIGGMVHDKTPTIRIWCVYGMPHLAFYDKTWNNVIQVVPVGDVEKDADGTLDTENQKRLNLWFACLKEEET